MLDLINFRGRTEGFKALADVYSWRALVFGKMGSVLGLALGLDVATRTLIVVWVQRVSEAG